MGEGVFKNCTGLTSVTSSGSITSIPVEAFRGCSNLTSINLSNIRSISVRGFA